MKTHLLPTEESQKEFYLRYKDKDGIVMLNMLKFRKEADYSRFDQLDPGQPISGREAYKLYMGATAPILKKVGGKVLYFGSSKSFVIGPEDEQWDSILLVQYPSAEAFIGFAQRPDYLKTAGHRSAALEDSRLLPTSQPPISQG